MVKCIDLSHDDSFSDNLLLSSQIGTDSHFCLVFGLSILFSLDGQKKRKRSSSLVMSKKKRKLLPFNPTEDPSRRMEQMASLATALTATGTEFSNELTYMPGTAPRSANQSILEHGGMQVSDLIRKHSRLGQVN